VQEGEGPKKKHAHWGKHAKRRKAGRRKVIGGNSHLRSPVLKETGSHCGMSPKNGIRGRGGRRKSPEGRATVKGIAHNKSFSTQKHAQKGEKKNPPKGDESVQLVVPLAETRLWGEFGVT